DPIPAVRVLPRHRDHSVDQAAAANRHASGAGRPELGSVFRRDSDLVGRGLRAMAEGTRPIKTSPTEIIRVSGFVLHGGFDRLSPLRPVRCKPALKLLGFPRMGLFWSNCPGRP